MDSTAIPALLASCFAISALLGVRHQHLSSLIREKTKEIKSLRNLETDESRKLVVNAMKQIEIFYKRNNRLRLAVYSSFIADVLFSLEVIPPIPWTFSSYFPAYIGFGFLVLALGIVCYEFHVSPDTLEFEILSVEYKVNYIKFPFKNKDRDKRTRDLEDFKGRLNGTECNAQFTDQ